MQKLSLTVFGDGMIDMAKNIYRILGYFESMFAVVVFSLLTLSSFGGVIMRYVFKYPLPELDEICIFSMIWIISIGAAIASRTQEHIKSDILTLLVHDKITIGVVTLIINLVGLAVIVVFGIWSFPFWVKALRWGEASTTLNLPIVLVKISFFVSAILMAIHQMVWIGKNISELRRERENSGS